jgi:hypothetical protein
MLLRLLARLVGFLWAVALALLALGVAIYCLDGLVRLGSARPDRLLHLVAGREKVAHFLARVEAPGHVASLAFLCGVAAVIVGLALLRGLLGSPRPRLALMEGASDGGELGARRRVLRQVAGTLAADAESVVEVKRVRLALRRNGMGGRLRLDVALAPDGEAPAGAAAVQAALEPICEPFNLKGRVHTRPARERVERS